MSLIFASLFANPLAIVELVGVYYLGCKVWGLFKGYPNLFHLDSEHLLIWSLVVVTPLLFFVFSPMMFALAFTGGSTFVIAIVLIQVVLFVIGVVQLVHLGFQLFGDKKKVR